MSKFSNEEVRRLQELFQIELNLEVSEKEACQHAAQLLDLLLITYKDEPEISSNSPPW